MLGLDQSLMKRHSTRMFLPRPVPQESVEEALALAQHDTGSDGTRFGYVRGGLGGGLSGHSSQRAKDCA